MTMQTAVFTVVSANYGACALTLMESLCLTHPDWHRHVLLVDQVEDPAGFGEGLFLTTLVEDLLLPKQREFLFRYEIVELNTAVKPYMFAHLRRLGFERVVYIDPDVLVVDRLVDVERLLDEGACAAAERWSWPDRARYIAGRLIQSGIPGIVLFAGGRCLHPLVASQAGIWRGGGSQ